MEKGHEIWYVECKEGLGSLTTVARVLSWYKLYLVGVQEVRLDKGGKVTAGDYFFYGKGKENNQLGTGFVVHHRTVSAVRRVKFVSDRTSYIVLRGRLCEIIVLYVYAPNEEKSDDSKDNFYDGFDYFPKHRMKSLLGDHNTKLGREDIFKPTIGNESLQQDKNDNGIRIVNFATSKAPCSGTETFIKTCGPLLM
jgi:exonuclease III